MEFFRKYQRVILYSAGIFALVSFSVTGPILGFFDQIFTREVPMPTLEIRGETVPVTLEDNDIAGRIARWERFGDPTAVLPPIVDSAEDTSRVEIYAALRRVALTYGIEVSDVEVDRAIELGTRLMGAADADVQTPTDMALRMGFASLNAYREVVREAMRIGTLARAEALGVGVSDAAIVESLLRDLELVGMDIAVIDAEAIEESVEADLGELDDATLRAWLEELEPADRSMFTDPDRYRAQLAYLELEPFDPAQFEAELADREIADAEIQQFYEAQRFQLFRVEAADSGGDEDGGDEQDGGDEDGGDGQGGGEQGGGDDGGGDDGGRGGDGGPGARAQGGQGGQPPADRPPGLGGLPGADPQDAPEAPQDPEFRELDDALRAEIRTRLQAEAVVEELWKVVRERFAAYAEAEQAAVDEALDAVEAARLARDDARAAAEATDLAEAERAELEAAAETAEAAAAEAEQALEEAERALTAVRQTFDLAGLWTGELAAGRPAFGVAETGDEPKPLPELAEIEPVGRWPGSGMLGGLRETQPLGSAVQHTSRAVFGVRLLEREEAPLRPLEDIREEATSRYYAERADERAAAVVEEFEARLDELARAGVQDEIDAIEQERDADLERRLTEWREELEGRVADLRERVATLEQERGVRAKISRTVRSRLETAEAELADAEGHRAELEAELDAEAEEEIRELIIGQYPEVLEEAVAAVDQVALEHVEPLPRDLGSQARGARREDYSKAVQWAYFSERLEGLDEVGDARELTEDPGQRAWFLPVVTSVEEASAADLTRRQIVAQRRHAGQRRAAALVRGYSLDAIKARFGWRAPEAVAENADATQ